MTYAQQRDRSDLLPLAVAACILYAFVCIPAYAETGTADPVSGVQPVAIKITGDTDRDDPLLRTADASAATTPAAPDLLWKFAVFWDYQFYGKTAIPAVDGGYLIAGESRMNGTEESAQ